MTDHSLTPLIPRYYDYVSKSTGSTTDTYTYKKGGSGGTTVGTVTVTFTSTAKTDISSIART